jgi:hypothetical protein
MPQLSGSKSKNQVKFRRALRRAAVLMVAALLMTSIFPRFALAQAGSAAPKTLPETAIAPAGEAPPVTSGMTGDTESAAPSAPMPASESTPTKAHHKAVHKEGPYAGPVDAAQAKLQLKADSWAHAHPATSSPHVERVHAGKFVNVTGTTRSYVRVKLKSGATAFVPMSAVELSRPTDKVFRLTKDAAVVLQPTHYGKKIAEVHNGHDVHVVGTAMNYMKIRMKDGREGYIPTTALE